MSSFSPGLNMPFLVPGLGGHVPHNDALITLDAFARGAVDARSTAPSSPVSYETYIISGTPSLGTPWYLKGGNIAIFVNGAWRFIPPVAGLQILNRLDRCEWRCDGTNWSPRGCEYHGRHTAGQTTTTTSWAQVSLGSDERASPQSFTRGTGGDGAGDVKINYAGTYTCLFEAQVHSASNTSEFEVGISVGGQNSTTPLAKSVRRRSYTSGQYDVVVCSFTETISAGQYVAPLLRRVSGTGTPTLTAELARFEVRRLD